MRAELYLAFHNKFFLVTFLMMCAFAVFGVFYMADARESGFEMWRQYRFDENGVPLLSLFIPATTLYCKWLGGDAGQFTTAAFYFLAFLACAVPFSWSLLVEKKNCYDTQMVLRCGRGNYYFSKYLSAFLSGATVVAAPLLLNFLLSACFVPAFKPESYASLYYGITSTYLWHSLFLTAPVLYVLLYILLAGVMTGLWATVGVSVSFLARNRFAVIIVPYLALLFFHVFWNSFAASSFGIYTQLSPIYFILPREMEYPNNPYVILCWVLAILLLHVIVWRKKGWRNDVL